MTVLAVVLVDAVFPGGPASFAGIRPGDVIMAIDGKEIIDEQGMNFRVATIEDGTTRPVAVLSNGMISEVDVTFSLPPENPGTECDKTGWSPSFPGCVCCEYVTAL